MPRRQGNAGLAGDVLIGSDFPDSRATVDVNLAHFRGTQARRDIVPLARDDLNRSAGTAG